MFGIGLPEMIVIFAVALIVVGPDKLPGLARSLAKGMLEMKKALNQVRESMTEEGEELNSVQQDLHRTAEELRQKMLDADPSAWNRAGGPGAMSEEEIIEMEAAAENAANLNADAPPETAVPALDTDNLPAASATAAEKPQQTSPAHSS